jgi:hypothetical protein
MSRRRTRHQVWPRLSSDLRRNGLSGRDTAYRALGPVTSWRRNPEVIHKPDVKLRPPRAVPRRGLIAGPPPPSGRGTAHLRRKAVHPRMVSGGAGAFPRVTSRFWCGTLVPGWAARNAQDFRRARCASSGTGRRARTPGEPRSPWILAVISWFRRRRPCVRPPYTGYARARYAGLPACPRCGLPRAWRPGGVEAGARACGSGWRGAALSTDVGAGTRRCGGRSRTWDASWTVVDLSAASPS